MSLCLVSQSMPGFPVREIIGIGLSRRYKSKTMITSGWKKYVYGLIAKELSLITRYYDRVLQWMPRPDDSGLLLDAIDCQRKELIKERDDFPDLSKETAARTAVLLNGTINHHYDIQGLLLQIAPRLSRTTRILIVAYNPYFSWLYRLANRIGIRKGEVPTTFITRVDLENIAKLAGYAIVRTRLEVYVPWKLFGIGTLLNHVLSSVPVVRWFGLVYLAVLRPVVPEASKARPSLSCVVPARNERGNIENCIQRLPDLGCDLEVIFVEGHSTDGTWEEILRGQGSLWSPLHHQGVSTDREGEKRRRETRFFPGRGRSADDPRCGPDHASGASGPVLLGILPGAR